MKNPNGVHDQYLGYSPSLYIMQKNIFYLSLLTLLGVLLYACTPKTTEAAKTETVTATKVKTKPKRTVELSPCQKWVDETFEQEALETHVLYRDQMKAQNYLEALPLWKQVYEMAPAADGQRDVHYMDGARIYKYLITYEKSTTDAQKAEYKQKVFDLYNQAMECYPKKATDYKALAAYDYFYTFPGTKSEEEIYGMYKEIVDADGLETSVSVLNPFTSLVVNLLLEDKIPMAEAQKYAGKIDDIFNHNKKELSATTWKKQGWDIVESYTPARLEQLEGIKGFYGCEHFRNKYLAEYKDNPTDCENIATFIARMKYGGCADTDTDLVAARAARVEHCIVAPPPSGPLTIARDCLENGDYDCAIANYEEFVNSTDDMDKKATYNLRIAKIYYVHKKKYSKARQFARKAASQKSNWGAPYMLIGTMYASSGPLCGPGTGFDSQRVTWVAIDKWNKAKSIDPSVAAQANKLINRYKQYMPTKADIFQRNIQEGSTYKVPCWIQENTTVRVK